jgi:hypothetical protein
MLEIFKGAKGRMVLQDNLIHINIIFFKRESFTKLGLWTLDLQYSTYVTYISVEINQETKKKYFNSYSYP